MLDPHRKANQLWLDAASSLLFGRELTVRSRGGMNSETLRITDLGKMREERKTFDELRSSLSATLDPEDDHGPTFAIQILIIQCSLQISF